MVALACFSYAQAEGSEAATDGKSEASRVHSCRLTEDTVSNRSAEAEADVGPEAVAHHPENLAKEL